jgi:hypothetical protein
VAGVKRARVAPSLSFASYGYTWDASDRITAVGFLDGTYEDVTYSHDDAGQVTGADRDGSGVVLDDSIGLCFCRM